MLSVEYTRAPWKLTNVNSLQYTVINGYLENEKNL